MFLTDYNEQKVLEEGGMSASFIARISKLSEETVWKLAESLETMD